MAQAPKCIHELQFRISRIVNNENCDCRSVLQSMVQTLDDNIVRRILTKAIPDIIYPTMHDKEQSLFIDNSVNTMDKRMWQCKQQEFQKLFQLVCDKSKVQFCVTPRFGDNTPKTQNTRCALAIGDIISSIFTYCDRKTRQSLKSVNSFALLQSFTSQAVNSVNFNKHLLKFMSRKQLEFADLIFLNKNSDSVKLVSPHGVWPHKYEKSEKISDIMYHGLKQWYKKLCQLHYTSNARQYSQDRTLDLLEMIHNNCTTLDSIDLTFSTSSSSVFERRNLSSTDTSETFCCRELDYLCLTNQLLLLGKNSCPSLKIFILRNIYTHGLDVNFIKCIMDQFCCHNDTNSTLEALYLDSIQLFMKYKSSDDKKDNEMDKVDSDDRNDFVSSKIDSICKELNRLINLQYLYLGQFRLLFFWKIDNVFENISRTSMLYYKIFCLINLPALRKFTLDCFEDSLKIDSSWCHKHLFKSYMLGNLTHFELKNIYFCIDNTSYESSIEAFWSIGYACKNLTELRLNNIYCNVQPVDKQIPIQQIIISCINCTNLKKLMVTMLDGPYAVDDHELSDFLPQSSEINPIQSVDELTLRFGAITDPNVVENFVTFMLRNDYSSCMDDDSTDCRLTQLNVSAVSSFINHKEDIREESIRWINGFISGLEKASFCNLNVFDFKTDATCFVCSAPLVLSSFCALLRWQTVKIPDDLKPRFDINFATIFNLCPNEKQRQKEESMDMNYGEVPYLVYSSDIQSMLKNWQRAIQTADLEIAKFVEQNAWVEFQINVIGNELNQKQMQILTTGIDLSSKQIGIKIDFMKQKRYTIHLQPK